MIYTPLAFASFKRMPPMVWIICLPSAVLAMLLIAVFVPVATASPKPPISLAARTA